MADPIMNPQTQTGAIMPQAPSPIVPTSPQITMDDERKKDDAFLLALKKQGVPMEKAFELLERTKKNIQMEKTGLTVDVGGKPFDVEAERAKLPAFLKGKTPEELAEMGGTPGIADIGKGTAKALATGALRTAELIPIQPLQETLEKTAKDIENMPLLKTQKAFGIPISDIAGQVIATGVPLSQLNKLRTVFNALPAIQKLPSLVRLALNVGAGMIEGGVTAGALAPLEQKEEAVKTGAILGGAAPALGQVLIKGKEVLGKVLPERLLKSATWLTKGQRTNIMKKLEQAPEMVDDINPTNAEQFLLKRKLTGTQEEISDQLLDISKKAKTQKTDVLNKISKEGDIVKSQEADNILSELTDKLEDVKSAAMQKDLARATELLKKSQKAGGLMINELDETKSLFDKYFKIYKQTGDVKGGFLAEDLANQRSTLRKLIETEANTRGVKNIAQLNNDIALGRMFGEAVKTQTQAGGSAMIKLADMFAGGVGGFALPAKDWGERLRNIGLGVLARRVFSPKNKTVIAQWLSKTLNKGEAGSFLKFLTGETNTLSKTIQTKLKNEKTKLQNIIKSVK